VVSLSYGEEGLQLKFLAPFAPVVTFHDSVAFAWFFDLFSHFRGFLFRPKRFPIERRPGCPPNMVVNTEVYSFYFAALSIAYIHGYIFGNTVLRNHEAVRISDWPETHTNQKALKDEKMVNFRINE
jgi:hypothetical protein